MSIGIELPNRIVVANLKKRCAIHLRPDGRSALGR